MKASSSILVNIPPVIDTLNIVIKQLTITERELVSLPSSDTRNNAVAEACYASKKVSELIQSLTYLVEDVRKREVLVPTAGIRRWVVQDGKLAEVSLERAAELDGLSVNEYLAKEEVELGYPDFEADFQRSVV